MKERGIMLFCFELHGWYQDLGGVVWHADDAEHRQRELFLAPMMCHMTDGGSSVDIQLCWLYRGEASAGKLPRCSMRFGRD